MSAMDWSNVVASSDIATRVGVERAVVSNWISRYPEFPEPVHKVAGGATKLWLWSDVELWLEKKRRQTL